MFRHMYSTFLDTLDELGGLKGIGLIAVGIFFFVLIVQNSIAHRHTYSANFDRLRTAPVRKRK